MGYHRGFFAAAHPARNVAYCVPYVPNQPNLSMIDYDTTGDEETTNVLRPDAALPRGSRIGAMPRLIARPLSARVLDHHRRPGDGEIHIWRFQSHWVPVQSAVSHAWLSALEWENARRHTAPAARRRFLTTRVAVRWLLGGIADLAPDDPSLRTAQSGRFDHPDAASSANMPLFVDVAQAAAWTLIGIASEPFTLACTVAPTEQVVLGAPSAMSPEVEGMDTETIDLPMPAPVSARIVCATQPLRIRGFGWRAGEVLER